MVRARRFSAAWVASLCLACSEAPLITDTLTGGLNAPVSLSFIPGTSLAVAVNANVNFANVSGSIVAVDLASRASLPETAMAIPSLAGQVIVDAARSRLYVADRGHDAVLVYDYAVSGEDGRAISFSEHPVPDAAKGTLNGVRTDREPFGLLVESGSRSGEVLLAANLQSGSVSVIDLETLTPIDFLPEDAKLNGLPLVSAANFKQAGKWPFPGRGASRLVRPAGTSLAFVNSTVTNNIFVVNTRALGVQAMIDLGTVAPPGGTRGIAVASGGLAYVAHHGVRGILVLDVSDVGEEGNLLAVKEARLVETVLTGRSPEAVLLSSGGERLFVSNTGDNTVTVIDTASRRVVRQITGVGLSPGDLVPDPAGPFIYVLNFLSNDIAVLNESGEGDVEVIR